MLAALLALAASLAWGSSDFLAGLQSRRRSVWSVVAVAQAAAFVGAGLVLAVHGEPPIGLGGTAMLVLAGVGSALAMVLYYKALATGTMGIVASILATSATVPVVAGLVRGERPSAAQVAGMALAIAGIVLVSRTEQGAERSMSATSFVYALLAALAFGFMLVALDLGGRIDPYWSVFDARLGSALTIAAYLLLRRPQLEVTVKVAPVLATVGLLLVAANTLFTVATTRGYLSVVAVLGSLSPAVTALFARYLLAERLTRLQLVGVVTVLAGVVLLAVG